MTPRRQGLAVGAEAHAHDGVRVPLERGPRPGLPGCQGCGEGQAGGGDAREPGGPEDLFCGGRTTHATPPGKVTGAGHYNTKHGPAPAAWRRGATDRTMRILEKVRRG